MTLRVSRFVRKYNIGEWGKNEKEMVDDVTGHDYTDDLSGKCFCSGRSDER
ncbi:hypothetical protein D3C75_623560 [compost metagenome]